MERRVNLAMEALDRLREDKGRIADRIEVKVKLRCDVGTNWEDIEPETWDARAHSPETIVNHFYIRPDRVIGQQIWEVRWNWEGSNQGHYAAGAGHFHNAGTMPAHVRQGKEN